MVYPERFANLPVATWPRLRGLLDAVQPGGDVINMTIGDPQHDFPDFVGEVLNEELGRFRSYPNNNGEPALLDAIAGYVQRRYGVALEHDNLIVANGTREALYNAAMALCRETKGGQRPIILTPNPFYQVYAVAALSVGAEPVYVNATTETGHLPDFASLPKDVLDRTAVAYICSPANPQGAVADAAYWKTLIALAEAHDFIIFADECYAEVYRDTPPIGVLEVAQEVGADPERIVAFHSLSKRSNLAGLRSGFVASGPENIKRIRTLRAYAGSPVAGPVQAVSTRAWSDDSHSAENRALYAAKFDVADQILGDMPGYRSPPAGFFLWLPVDNGEAAALKLWRETGVRTLPGSYLSHDTPTGNPGEKYIRVALVAPKEDVQRGLNLLRDCIKD